jgi:thioredoxin 1
MPQTLPTSFEALIRENPLPVFVDFWAEWCGPCKTIAPAIRQISQDFKGKLTVVKVNVDQKPLIAKEYRIQSIPTLMLFKNGKIDWQVAGALPYERLKAELSARL